MTPPKYQCGVCGYEEEPEVVEALVAHGYDYWQLHRIELKGGVVQVLTCPDCCLLTSDLILESYKERIREGLIPCYH